MITNERVELLHTPNKGKFGDKGELETVATMWANVAVLGTGNKQLVDRGILDKQGVTLRLNTSNVPVHTDLRRKQGIYTLVGQTSYNELTVLFYVVSDDARE